MLSSKLEWRPSLALGKPAPTKLVATAGLGASNFEKAFSVSCTLLDDEVSIASGAPLSKLACLNGCALGRSKGLKAGLPLLRGSDGMVGTFSM